MKSSSCYRRSLAGFSKYCIHAFSLIQLVIVIEAINNINFLLIWISTINSTYSAYCAFYIRFTLTLTQRDGLPQICNKYWFYTHVILHQKCFTENFPYSNFKKICYFKSRGFNRELYSTTFDDWLSLASRVKSTVDFVLPLFRKHNNLSKSKTTYLLSFLIK